MRRPPPPATPRETFLPSAPNPLSPQREARAAAKRRAPAAACPAASAWWARSAAPARRSWPRGRAGSRGRPRPGAPPAPPSVAACRCDGGWKVVREGWWREGLSPLPPGTRHPRARVTSLSSCPTLETASTRTPRHFLQHPSPLKVPSKTTRDNTNLDVGVVHQRVQQLQRAAADRHVGVAHAGHHRRAVALHRQRVHGDDLWGWGGRGAGERGSARRLAPPLASLPPKRAPRALPPPRLSRQHARTSVKLKPYHKHTTLNIYPSLLQTLSPKPHPTPPRTHLGQRVERHVADVVVARRQELACSRGRTDAILFGGGRRGDALARSVNQSWAAPPPSSQPLPQPPLKSPAVNAASQQRAQDVDRHDAQAADGLHPHDRLHRLVQYGVPRVARRVHVRRHLYCGGRGWGVWGAGREQRYKGREAAAAACWEGRGRRGAAAAVRASGRAGQRGRRKNGASPPSLQRNAPAPARRSSRPTPPGGRGPAGAAGAACAPAGAGCRCPPRRAPANAPAPSARAAACTAAARSCGGRRRRRRRFPRCAA